ncbi:hypothetical protein [Halorubrum amylolyticum]|uniref:hypothetical protein n=1 Tax=Halorubrum amylolyticum TaxID=2508724 RepID=UPI00100880DD|nr:hypothetical protein [Halorubrum amylolyticum]
MEELATLPAGWDCVTEHTNYDSIMDREYTTVAYEHADTGRKVFINDVQEPNSFGGWGYLVRADGPKYGELGLVEDIESAKELAMEFMNEYEKPN